MLKIAFSPLRAEFWHSSVCVLVNYFLMELKGSKLFITSYLLSTFAKSFFDKYWELEGQEFLSEWDKINFSSTHRKNIFLVEKIFSSEDIFWSVFVIFLQQDVDYLNSFLEQLLFQRRMPTILWKARTSRLCHNFLFWPLWSIHDKYFDFCLRSRISNEDKWSKKTKENRAQKEPNASIDQTTRKISR